MTAQSAIRSLFLIAAFPVGSALGADVPKFIAFEMSPVAPIAAVRESSNGNATSMWDFGTDFNVGGRFTTGPELWLGTFAMRSDASSPEERIRREDLQYGERQKLDATRLKWNITIFESGYGMRGWFVKGGYSYTKVLSRANRFYEVSDYSLDNAANVESNITDYRHGVYGAFGQRWHFWDHRASVSLAAAYTHNFRRRIHVEGEDADAEADYLDLIERIPDTRLSARPMPTADFRIGFLF